YSANQARRIRAALTASNSFTVVEVATDADVILDIRLPNESAGGAGYHRGTATGSAFRPNSTANNSNTTLCRGVNPGQLVTGIQNGSGNLDVKMGDISRRVNKSAALPPQAKTELNGLLDQLHLALKALPADKAEDAEVIAESADEAVDETLKEKPRPKKLAL